MTKMKFTEANSYLEDIVEPGVDKDYFKMSRQRYATILSLIPDVGEKLCVLDVGSGFGHLSILVKKIFDYDVYAVDCNNLREERLYKEGIKFNIYDLRTESLPFGRSLFDIVLFCDVIEHLFNLPTSILLDIHRILKPQGKLILTTPNLYSLLNRIYFSLGRRIVTPVNAIGDIGRVLKPAGDDGEFRSLIETQLRKQEQYGEAHFRLYDINELRSLLNETGFRIIQAKCFPYGGIFEGLHGDLNLNPLHVIYRLFVNVYTPWSCLIYIIAQKE